jgi:hypothetical protein
MLVLNAVDAFSERCRQTVTPVQYRYNVRVSTLIFFDGTLVQVPRMPVR